MATDIKPRRRFQLILIKPSRYDDDGYVVQWVRSMMPSNSLAALYGLAADAADRQVLGLDVAIDVLPLDEANTRIKPNKIIARLKAHDGFGLVCLVGVQSNQFPRAMDIARPLRSANIPVVVGGFHVSGCISMLAELPPDLQQALDWEISLFAGEAEEQFDDLLRHAAGGRLQPIYNFLRDLPPIQSAPVPFLLLKHVKRTSGTSTFDAGRGCPYQCSFCTIINVQGKKSRRRSPDDIERIIRQNWAEGIHRFFITDDNLARNKDWELILDRIINLREEHGVAVNLTVQVDALSHKIPRFIEKCGKAGVSRVFIGLESVNPDTLIAAKKRQNKLVEYRKLLLAWKAANVITCAGYILGFPKDTPETIRRDIEIIQQELPIDLLEFFCLTPLPGSEDHQTLHRRGIAMDADMNRYDTEHVVTAHPLMSRANWQTIYSDAWRTYYTPAHMERILRRAATTDINLSKLAGSLLHFSKFDSVEQVHPLQGGIFRLKFRRDRRPTFAIEPAWLFYLKYIGETISKLFLVGRAALHLYGLARRIEADPQRKRYMDHALMPFPAGDLDSFQLAVQAGTARAGV